MGSEHIPGVIPLAVEDVFQTIKNVILVSHVEHAACFVVIVCSNQWHLFVQCPKKEFLLRVSYMEIYNETVTDLLVDSWKRKPLEVRETINVSELLISVTSVFLIKSLQVYISVFNKQSM